MQDRVEDRTAPGGESTARRADSLIADLAKKAVASSVGALLSSEEGIRALVGAMVPKEIGAYVARELSQLRSELMKALRGEVSRFLGRIDLAEELKKAISGLTFDVHVTVGVTKNPPPAPPAPPAPVTVSRATPPSPRRGRGRTRGAA